MAWSTPRNWNSGETVTASLMNVHLRDQLNVLKTSIDDNGKLKTLYAAPSVSPNSGTGDTQMASFSVPAGDLGALGQGFEIEMGGALANNTNAKYLRLFIGSVGSVCLSAYATALATNRFHWRIRVTRDSSSTTARVSSWVTVGGGGDGTVATIYHVGGTQLSGLSGSGWGSAQTIALNGQGGATNDIIPTSCVVNAIR